MKKVVWALLLGLINAEMIGTSLASGASGPGPSSSKSLRDDVSTSSPVERVQKAFGEGRLSSDERAIYTINAIKHPSRLPLDFRGEGAGERRYASREITLVLRDIRLNWSALSDSAQRYVQSALTRWNTAFSLVSPSGFFRLHYDTLGSNAVAVQDLDSDGIPDLVEKCASYLDSSIIKQLSLGYIAPPSDGSLGGDGLYDVYFEHMPYYGYTVPESAGSQPWNDYTSYLVLHNSFQGFPPNSDPEGGVAGAAKVTCAHEFHHAIQFAYSAVQPRYFMELDAVSMETIVYPQVNDNYNYLSYFYNFPETSLMDSSLHEYASFPWGTFLAERFDTSLMVAAWQGARYHSVFNVMDDTLRGRYGWSEDSAFALFEAWNFCTGNHADHMHFRDAANYPPVAIGRIHDAYPVSNQVSPKSPNGYGACYVQFVPNGLTGNLRLTFDGDDSRNWAAIVIATSDDSTHEIDKLSLNPITFSDSTDIPGFENYQSITLVGVNLSPNSSGASFVYSARVHKPYVLTTELQPGPELYAGGTRLFTYTVTVPSGPEDIVKIRYWDDAGWMHPDSTTRDIFAGTSSTVTVSVLPPRGTLLGSTSGLHFVALSLSDTTVHKSDSLLGVTVLQRGDLNFSGFIDLGDLSYMVSYLSGGGPPPAPTMEAGNFNCSGIVDLGDLSTIVSYLTGSGGRPPCNPF